MLDVGKRVRALINEGKDANEIDRAARIEGMENLREAALRKLAEGTPPTKRSRASRWTPNERERRGRRAARSSVRAGWRLAAFETFEEERALNLLERVATGGERKLRHVDARRRARRQRRGRRDRSTRASRAIARCEEPALFAMLDAHRWLDDAIALRRLRDLLPSLGARKQCVVLVGPGVPSARRDRARRGPRRAAAARAPPSSPLCSQRVLEQGDAKAPSPIRRYSVEAIRGRARTHVRRGGARACARRCAPRARSTRARWREIVRDKRRALHRTPALTFLDDETGLADVGGLGELKSWLARAPARVRRRGGGFGLPTPRGLLLLGVQGCGKSLVGQARWRASGSSRCCASTSRPRSAASAAPSWRCARRSRWRGRSRPPCSGSTRSRRASPPRSPTRVASRVFGSFLTWLSEKREPVFVVATANDVQGLPPELLRRGRFDELFFVDLPTPAERAEILRIHLRQARARPAPVRRRRARARGRAPDRRGARAGGGGRALHRVRRVARALRQRPRQRDRADGSALRHLRGADQGAARLGAPSRADGVAWTARIADSSRPAENA